jgi:hypothetical protein
MTVSYLTPISSSVTLQTNKAGLHKTRCILVVYIVEWQILASRTVNLHLYREMDRWNLKTLIEPPAHTFGLFPSLRRWSRTPTASRHETKETNLTSASWLRPVCGGFHNLIRFKCAPFFGSCRRHRVLTVTCLDACWCAVYVMLLSCLCHARISS